MDLTQNYLDTLKATLDQLDHKQIDSMIELFGYAQREQKQIFTFGNGGSGATASHAAGDFIKGASFGLEKRFRMICINDNLPSMMAIANDTDWSQIFIESLKNYLNPGDVVIGISGSVNSENVIKALQYAQNNQAKTIAMCGFKGGKIAALADVVIHAKVNDMEVVEDVHMAVFNVVKKHMMARLHSEKSMGSTYDARIQ